MAMILSAIATGTFCWLDPMAAFHDRQRRLAETVGSAVPNGSPTAILYAGLTETL
jgi:hypothetical protein